MQPARVSNVYKKNNKKIPGDFVRCEAHGAARSCYNVFKISLMLFLFGKTSTALLAPLVL